MQERVLGAIIMGGIAILGVVWAVIEGVPPLVNAKKQESILEDKLVETVNAETNYSVESLDVRRVTFVTRDIEEEYRGQTRFVKKPVISLEGVTNDDQYFKCQVVSSNDYILDLQNKIGSSSALAHIAFEYDVYQNYSMTLSKLLNEIMDDKNTEFEDFGLGDGLYGRLQADAGATIYEINTAVRDYQGEKIYTVEEAIEAVKDYQYGERNETEVYLTGKVESVETIYEESTKITYYTIKLVSEGQDDLHKFEIYSAKMLDKTLNGADIVPGATVIAKGYLSTNMAYKSQAK